MLSLLRFRTRFHSRDGPGKDTRSRLTLWELSGGPFGGDPFFFPAWRPDLPGCRIIIPRPLGQAGVTGDVFLTEANATSRKIGWHRNSCFRHFEAMVSEDSFIRHELNLSFSKSSLDFVIERYSVISCAFYIELITELIGHCGIVAFDIEGLVNLSFNSLGADFLNRDVTRRVKACPK